MRSSWVRVGPALHPKTGFLARRGGRRHRRTGRVTAEIGGPSAAGPGALGPPGAGRGRKGPPLQPPDRGPARTRAPGLRGSCGVLSEAPNRLPGGSPRPRRTEGPRLPVVSEWERPSRSHWRGQRPSGVRTGSLEGATLYFVVATQAHGICAFLCSLKGKVAGSGPGTPDVGTRRGGEERGLEIGWLMPPGMGLWSPPAWALG